MYLLLYFRGMVGVVLLTVEELHLRVQQLLLHLDQKPIGIGQPDLSPFLTVNEQIQCQALTGIRPNYSYL